MSQMTDDIDHESNNLLHKMLDHIDDADKWLFTIDGERRQKRWSDIVSDVLFLAQEVICNLEN